MKSLILIALSLCAAFVVNAQAPQSPPHPPPPPPPAHYPRPPVHGYRPSYGPSHGGGLGGLGGLLPFLLLGKEVAEKMGFKYQWTMSPWTSGCIGVGCIIVILMPAVC